MGAQAPLVPGVREVAVTDRSCTPEGVYPELVEGLEEARAPLYGIGYGFRVAVLVWAAVALVWVVGRGW